MGKKKQKRRAEKNHVEYFRGEDRVVENLLHCGEDKRIAGWKMIGRRMG